MNIVSRVLMSCWHCLVTFKGHTVDIGGHITNTDVHPENTILCDDQAPLSRTHGFCNAATWVENGAGGLSWDGGQGGSMEAR